MSTFICVLGRQRSGTTVFRQMLKSQGAHDVSEIFHHDFSQNPENYFNFLFKKIKKDKKYIHPDWHREVFKEFLDFLEEKFDNEIILLDIKYNALNIIDSGSLYQEVPFAIKELASRQSYFVHITRKNKLKILVSELIAQRTGMWGQTQDNNSGITKDKKIYLSSEMALQTISRDEAFESKVSQCISIFTNSFSISYEEMFEKDGGFSQSSQNIASEIFSLRPNELKYDSVSLIKQNPEPLEDLIENFDDLKSEFSDTPYAWMVAD